MIKRKIFYSALTLLIIIALSLFTSCERDIELLEPASYPETAEVFIDGFSAGLIYSAFGGSKVTAFDVDKEVKYKGTASMRFEVPDFEDPEGAYAGGSFFTSVGRDLSGYDALTFWARASKAASIDVIGFGNDAAELKYVTSILGLDVNTNWKKYVIPIPDPELLTSERGMLYYSEGPEDGKGYTFWIDEVKFEKLGTLAHQRPAILEEQDQTITAEVGENLPIGGTSTVFNMPTGIDQIFYIAPAHFTFSSSNADIASVNEYGVVSVLDTGNAVITAELAGIEAEGSLTVDAVGALPAPSVPAPVPTASPDSVISMFSNAYTDVPVDTWNPFWEFSTTLVQDLQIEGNDVKRYTKLNFVGIEFLSQTINASEMTHFSIDIWTPDPTDPPAAFNILLVDVGPDGVIGGEDNSSHEVSISSPTLKTSEWVTLHIPFSDFTGLTSRAQLGQLVLSGDPNTVYVDNVYFYNDGSGGGGGGEGEPTEAAPAPSQDAGDVISVFSDSYTNIDGTNLNPDWGQATAAAEIPIAGNNTLRYVGLNYQGIELGSSQDVSGMEYLHLDFWTANSSALNVYLISAGPVEAAYALTVPTDGWSSIDIPLSSFAPVSLSDVIQLKFDGDGNIYMDNIYFHSDGGGGNPTEPAESAPAPTADASNVLSIFSDVYTDVDGTNLNPDWGQATVATEIPIAGNNTLYYAGLNYQGIELGSNQDVSGLEYLHLDIWTANSSALSTFLISTGPVETEYMLTVPTAGWASLDIPLTSFSPVDLSDVIQLKFDGDGDIYLDNIYFYKTGGGGSPTEPAGPPPEPTQAAADVVSIFSDTYSDVDGTNFFPDWGQSTVVTTEDIQGSAALKYANFNYQGIELTGPQDLSDMQYLHIDMWTIDATVVKVTPINGSGSPVESLVSMTPISNGIWNSYDIPLTEFTNSGMSLDEVLQMKFDGQDGTNPSNIYLDNIYFYKEGGGGGTPTEPGGAAPAPAFSADDVISLFSNAYTNVNVDTWSAEWPDDADVEDVQIAGDDVKLYTNLNFAGIEFTSQTIDASEMTHFHMHIWTPDATDLPAVFKIKLVDFGANGTYDGGGDDVEHELTLDASSTPALATGSWVELDISLAEFAGLTTKGHLAQLIISGDPNTVYVDNMLFHK